MAKLQGSLDNANARIAALTAERDQEKERANVAEMTAADAWNTSRAASHRTAVAMGEIVRLRGTTPPPSPESGGIMWTTISDR